MRLLAAILVFIASVLAPSNSRAALTPIHFEGQVTSITPSLYYGLSSLGVIDGTPIAITVVVDTSTLDSVPADPTQGTYVNSVTSVSITAGSWSANTAAPFQATVFVVNQNQPSQPDTWIVETGHLNATDSPAVLGTLREFQLAMTDSSAGTTITSDSILPPNSNSWAGGSLLFENTTGSVQAQIFSSRVPEPSVMAALGASLLAVGIRRRWLA
jgi:hypothetical protein